MRHLIKLTFCGVLLITNLAIVLAAPSTEGGKQWQEYYDSDYGFKFEYPIENWHSEVPWYVTEELSPNTIAKRINFFSPYAIIIVDVWNQPKEDLVGWVSNYSYQPFSEREITLNAKVASFPAVVFTEGGGGVTYNYRYCL